MQVLELQNLSHTILVLDFLEDLSVAMISFSVLQHWKREYGKGNFYRYLWDSYSGSFINYFAFRNG